MSRLVHPKPKISDALAVDGQLGPALLSHRATVTYSSFEGSTELTA
jgi:hypothetical protein